MKNYQTFKTNKSRNWTHKDYELLASIDYQVKEISSPLQTRNIFEFSEGNTTEKDDIYYITLRSYL